MVIYRSEFSRSRTSIHGGLRRGAAAAAVGAVLVLSAGVPASQAADGSTDPTVSAEVAADGDLDGVNGLLNVLVGGSGGRSTASPEPTPAPSSSSTPTATATPSPAPTSTAPTSSEPTSSAPTSASPAPQGATSQGTAPQSPGSPSSAPAPLSTSRDAGSPAGTQPNGHPGAPAGGTEDAGQEADPAADQPTQDAHNATPVSNPKRPGNAPASREDMASATEAAAAAEPAKVWLGVGLVGSAGAAGLLFARIRRI
ncbi:hypothetical protein [Pseudarthrobacter sp. Y6]|uniref:hypothetical protein n=1 Tax=Pseudarthrobacter sp. Y6 TaxID=3418422 RepID=UPI003CEBD2AB